MAQVKPALQRWIGIGSSVLLVIGLMIGTGIFKKIVPMAASGMDSTGILAAWAVAGLITLFGAMTVAGLAPLTAESGGEYEYIRLIYGDFAAYLFGWASFTIIGSASAAAMSFLLIQSLDALWPGLQATTGLRLPAFSMGAIVVVTLYNMLGTRPGTRLNNVLTYGKLIGVLVLIAGGFFFFAPEESAAVLTDSPGHPIPSLSVFLAAMLSAFWAYDGWLSVAFVSGEIRNPARNVPLALIIGILVVMVLYLLLNAAFLNVLSPAQLAALGENDIAASVISDRLFGGRGGLFISSLIFISALGSLNGIVLTYSRIYYKMALDGSFLPAAGRVHPRFHSPHIALLLAMGMSCLLVFAGNFDELTDTIVFAGFLFYGLLAVGLIRLRRSRKLTATGTGYPWIPAIYILFTAGMIISSAISAPGQMLVGAGLILAGVPFYFLFRAMNKGKKRGEIRGGAHAGTPDHDR